MKKVVLKRLVLSNWKSQNSDVVFDAQLNTVVGRNGTGKTNLMRAWLWLLTGYTDPLLPRNSELYDNRVELNEKTPVASVKAYVEIDGTEFMLEKRACAKFVRRRGTDIFEKAASDDYTIFIDDIETSVADWKLFVTRNLCPLEVLHFCMSGRFFAELAGADKDKARAILEQIVGTVRDDELKGDYSEILPKLKTLTISEIINQAQNGLRPLKARLNEIPAIIERNEKDLADYDQTDFDSIKREMDDVREEIKNIDNDMLAASKSIEPLVAKRREQVEAKMKAERALQDAEANHKRKIEDGASDIRAQLANIDATNRERTAANNRANARLQSLDDEIAQAKRDKDRLSKRREELLSERDAIMARVFKPSKCSYCGQELPIEKQEEMQRKFNEQKESDRDRIVAEGKSVRARLDACEANLQTLEAERSKGVETQALLSRAEVEKELEDYYKKQPAFADTNEYITLKKAVDDCVVDEVANVDNSALISQKSEKLEKLEQLNRKYGLKAKRDALEKEIADLNAEKKDVGIKAIGYEKTLAQIDAYIRERADIVSQRVNSSFLNMKIMMQRRQKDGSLVDDCVICQKDGTKFNTSNGAAKAMMEAELQRFFNNSYGVNMPLWVDESNTINPENLPINPGGQTIRIRCSDDKQVMVNKQ